VGNTSQVLEPFSNRARLNSHAVMAVIEVVKNSYSDKILGSEALGALFAGVRSMAIDTVEFSDFIKYNAMNFASGDLTSPSNYAWYKKAEN
jgi:hypothetical protein